MLRCAQWPESRKKLRKHRLGTIATIESILEFLGIEAKVFRADTGVSAVDRAFQVPPKVLDAIDGHIVAKAIIVIGIFASTVVHASVAIAKLRKGGVAAQFVGMDVAADPHVLRNERL